MPELAPTTSATWPVKSYGPVHGCFILAAQILVEGQKIVYTTTSPPPATRCVMSWKSTVLSSSLKRERSGDRRLRSSQLNTINPE
jgi:hypothetical protein